MKNINNCVFCGEKLTEQKDQGEERYYCPRCGEYRYRNPKPVAGVLVVRENEVLLIKRGNEPNKGTWSFPAGFLDYDESFPEAAFRELEEETQLEANLEEAYLTDTIQIEHSDHYVVGNIFAINHKHTKGIVKPSDDAIKAQYWTLSELKQNKNKLETEKVLESVQKAIETIEKE